MINLQNLYDQVNKNMDRMAKLEPSPEYYELSQQTENVLDELQGEVTLLEIKFRAFTFNKFAV